MKKNNIDFDFKGIESRWKDHWYRDNIYKAVDFSEKPKKYILVEFPYPSGKSMHVGHMMRYTLPEIYSRFLRMKGFNVLFPMGWDAFGLPAENYAIKTGNHPAVLTHELTDFYRNSMKDMGYGIDWDREINTTDPQYYKWTQWIFLKFYEKGLAELREEPVWWSDKMKSVLAEEEVMKDGDGNLVAERDGSPVRRRLVKQWVLKMPEYADKLIEGLDETDFPQSIIAAQRNWIGRKVGVNISYPVVGVESEIECFTTRADTNFGATFIVISPEHDFVSKIIDKEISVENYDEIKAYVDKAKAKTDLERMSEGKDKTGVDTGFKALNRISGKEIPIWISDFVLPHFGTGAVVGVPGHDVRDFQFADKFGIEVKRVVSDPNGENGEISSESDVFEDYGIAMNSDFLDGMESTAALEKIADYIEANKWGERVINYNLKDWIFSRQRYWGEPIPLVHHSDGSISAIASTDDPESVNANLPLELPELPDYSPTDDGASPLATDREWIEFVNEDGEKVERESNTMPNWAGSCWYYLRYIDPKNSTAIADPKKMEYWLPVDNYFGGSEHTTLHLLYSRFWHRFLFDNGVVPTKEPYKWRMNGGILLGPDGGKMSKSVGNVIEPQEKLDIYGADAVRMYISFIGPYNGTFPYSESSLRVCYKLVKDIYALKEKVGGDDDGDMKRILHKSIKRISDMADDMKVNTIVSEYMILVRQMKRLDQISTAVWKDFIKLIAPIAVFTAEELWQEINGYESWLAENSVHLQEWPKYDEELIAEDTIEVPVQVNGKLRGVVSVSSDASEDDVRAAVFADEKLASYISEEKCKKFIYVSGKVVNIVV